MSRVTTPPDNLVDAMGWTNHLLCRIEGLVEALGMVIEAAPHLSGRETGTAALREIQNALEERVEEALAAHEVEHRLRAQLEAKPC